MSCVSSMKCFYTIKSILKMKYDENIIHDGLRFYTIKSILKQ